MTNRVAICSPPSDCYENAIARLLERLETLGLVTRRGKNPDLAVEAWCDALTQAGVREDEIEESFRCAIESSGARGVNVSSVISAHREIRAARARDSDYGHNGCSQCDGRGFCYGVHREALGRIYTGVLVCRDCEAGRAKLGGMNRQNNF